MQMPACSHLMSNFDGTMLVGDGSGTPVDVKDTSGYTIDNDPYLYAFDVAKQATSALRVMIPPGRRWPIAAR
jgi:oligogalacturonide lyase